MPFFISSPGSLSGLPHSKPLHSPLSLGLLGGIIFDPLWSLPGCAEPLLLFEFPEFVPLSPLPSSALCESLLLLFELLPELLLLLSGFFGPSLVGLSPFGLFG